MKFSFIIPVYKVEQYLEVCVNSILSQTYTDYEIILVDDGSPDSCPKICDEFVRNNCNIKVIHKANGGSSDARNAGFQVASGEYIIYLDSDDRWIDDEGLSSIATIVEHYHPDIVVFGVENYNPLTGQRIISRGNYDDVKFNTSESGDIMCELIKTGNFPGAAWMLATKRNVLTKNNISFVKGVTAEDYDWIVRLFSNAHTIKTLNRVIYQYRSCCEGSITSRSRLSGVKGIHIAISNWLNSEKKKCGCITDYLCRVYLVELLNYANLSLDEKKIALPLLKQDKQLLRESSLVKYKLMYLIVCVWGINISAKAVKLLRN